MATLHAENTLENLIVSAPLFTVKPQGGSIKLIFRSQSGWNTEQNMDPEDDNNNLNNTCQ